MELWHFWWSFVASLRGAFSREKTFFWFVLALAGACIRPDLSGVTSYLRGVGLKPSCYGPILSMFHSSAIKLEKLTVLWTEVVLRQLGTMAAKSDGRIILVADGIKIAKSGRKMPAVKRIGKQRQAQLYFRSLMSGGLSACKGSIQFFCPAVMLPYPRRCHL